MQFDGLWNWMYPAAVPELPGTPFRAVAAAETEQLLATLTESSDQTSGMITSGRIGAMVHQVL